MDAVRWLCRVAGAAAIHFWYRCLDAWLARRDRRVWRAFLLSPHRAEATPVCLAHRLLRHAGVEASTAVVDLGCGSGQVLMAAALLGAKAHGVEWDPALARSTGALCEAFATVDCADATGLFPSGTHVFVAWTLMQPVERAAIEAHWRPGMRVITLTFPPKHARVLVHERLILPFGFCDAYVAEVHAQSEL